MMRTCLVTVLVASALSAAGESGATSRRAVVKVIEDFEGAGVPGLWQRVADAAVGQGAGLTRNVFKNWGGLALKLDGVPEGADGVTFWVRTDDGSTGAIDLALFESTTIDGRPKQTDAWGFHFWATPTWQKITFPLKKMRQIWAGRPDGRLHPERVTTIQFPRSLREGNGMRAAGVVFDQTEFVSGCKEATIVRKEPEYGLVVDAARPLGKIRRFWRALSPGPSGEQNTFLQGAAGEALRIIAEERTFDVIRLADGLWGEFR